MNLHPKPTPGDPLLLAKTVGYMMGSVTSLAAGTIVLRARVNSLIPKQKQFMSGEMFTFLIPRSVAHLASWCFHRVLWEVPRPSAFPLIRHLSRLLFPRRVAYQPYTPSASPLSPLHLHQ